MRKKLVESEEDKDLPPNKPIGELIGELIMDMEHEKETFIKVKGQQFAFKAINIVKADGWIEFDRVMTKGENEGKIQGHLSFPLSSIDSIEVR